MQVNDLLVLYLSESQSNIEDIHPFLSQTVKKVIYANDSKQARNQYKKFSPCLIIVDSKFEDANFVAFLQEVRKDDIKTAFVVITENIQNDYLFELMELYLTKYITKPFDNETLEHALKKCMQIIENRIYSNVRLKEGVYFNFQTQSIIKEKESIVLNKKESLLINMFIRNPDRILSYQEIEYTIWNNEVSNGAFKSLIRDLRKKTFKTFITNVSGVGYRLTSNYF